MTRYKKGQQIVAREELWSRNHKVLRGTEGIVVNIYERYKIGQHSYQHYDVIFNCGTRATVKSENIKEKL